MTSTMQRRCVLLPGLARTMADADAHVIAATPLVGGGESSTVLLRK
jgi:azurin